MYDISAKRVVTKFLAHSSNICVLSAVHSYLVSGSWDNTAKIWQDNHLLHTLVGHSAAVWTVLIQDDKTVFTGSADKTIKVWENGVCVATLIGHRDCVRDLQHIISKNVLMSAGNDGRLLIWDSKDHTLLSQVQAHPSYIYSICLCNQFVISVGEEPVVKLWEFEGRSQIKCVDVIATANFTNWKAITLSVSGYVVFGDSKGMVSVLTLKHLDITERKARNDLLEFNNIEPIVTTDLFENLPCDAEIGTLQYAKDAEQIYLVRHLLIPSLMDKAGVLSVSIQV